MLIYNKNHIYCGPSIEKLMRLNAWVTARAANVGLIWKHFDEA